MEEEEAQRPFPSVQLGLAGSERVRSRLLEQCGVRGVRARRGRRWTG